MHSTIPPFLYEDLVHLILEDRGLTRLLLYAGRGVGKTVVLRRIQRSLLRLPGAIVDPPDDSPGVRWVEGRSTQGKQVVLDWCKDPRGALLVDDFDHLFDKDVDDALMSISDRNQGEYRMVFGSRKPPPVLDAKVVEQKHKAGEIVPWDDSRALPTFTFRRLDPWADDWRRVLRSEHLEAADRLREELEGLLRSQEAVPRFATRAEVLLWAGVCADVTGGHPCLVDGAFDLFVALTLNGLVRGGWLEPEAARRHPLRETCRWERSLSLEDIERGTAGAGEEQRRGSVRALIEDYLATRGMVYLKSTMADLQATDPKAFSRLVDLAVAGKEVAVEDSELRERLLDSGLVCQNPVTRALSVPEGLVGTALKGMGGKDLPAPAPAPVPTPRPPVQVTGLAVQEGATRQAGVVLVSTPTGTLEVSLNGRPWEVFDYLWQRRDRWVPQEELMEPLGIPTEGSARNAIARLKEAFKEVGVEDVIDNRICLSGCVLPRRGRGIRSWIATKLFAFSVVFNVPLIASFAVCRVPNLVACAVKCFDCRNYFFLIVSLR
ncbi:MAG: hypothetical protein ABIO70_12140 [Pseudomonadota bacterium]